MKTGPARTGPARTGRPKPGSMKAGLAKTGATKARLTKTRPPGIARLAAAWPRLRVERRLRAGPARGPIGAGPPHAPAGIPASPWAPRPETPKPGTPRPGTPRPGIPCPAGAPRLAVRPAPRRCRVRSHGSGHRDHCSAPAAGRTLLQFPPGPRTATRSQPRPAGPPPPQRRPEPTTRTQICPPRTWQAARRHQRRRAAHALPLAQVTRLPKGPALRPRAPAGRLRPTLRISPRARSLRPRSAGPGPGPRRR
jgi:hypothetical protein